MDRYDRARWRRDWPRSSGGLIGGVILAGIGVLLLLQNLGIPYFEDLERYWPVILIVVGIVQAARSWGMGGRIWGGIVFAVGVVFLLSNLGIIHGDVWRFLWPALFITLGLGMLARAIDRNVSGPPNGASPGASAAKDMGDRIREKIVNNIHSEWQRGPGAPTSADQINEWAVFGGTRRRVESQDFQGGEAFSMFGGVCVDLRNAASTRDEIFVEANSIFGGIELRVPEAWTVTVKGVGIFGGYEDKTLDARIAPSTKQPHLIVSGLAMFGGVTVRN
ncbi:MAG TPA: DUF5668 domain-containing protein [Bryobacteraceae bacterium]|nr:DUF5668 domain-containing protein [Bryobacteraceae bacterium]